MCLCYHRPGAWNITWKLEPKQSLHWDPKPWSVYGHTTQNTPGLIWNHGEYSTVLVERRTSLFSFSHPVFQQFATDQTTQKPRERARIMQGISLKASRQLTVQVHQSFTTCWTAPSIRLPLPETLCDFWIRGYVECCFSQSGIWCADLTVSLTT